MFDTTAARSQNRLIGGFLSVALQAGLILVLLYGLAAPTIRAGMQSALTSLNLRTPPPPPPAPPPARHAQRRAAKAAPPARRAQVAPVVAPRVVALKPPPIIPVAPIPAQGMATKAGAAAAGIGSGAGGQGNGTGAGGTGDGDGDGDGDGAELVSGRIKSSDTPAHLFHAPFSGTTSALVMIDATGAMTACQTEHSSGNATLDTLTCHLIATRFHFRPAHDPTGRAVPGKILYDQDWEITGAFDP